MPIGSISIYPANGNSSVIEINCGTSTPKLSGSIDVTMFPNLTGFTCVNNDITNIVSYENLTELIEIDLSNNKLTSPIPNLSNLTKLQDIRCFTNDITGTIPNLNTLSDLFFVGLGANKLTGSIPNIDNLTNLQYLYVQNNNLTGAIPSLSTNSKLRIFLGLNNTGINSFNGGSVSNTLGQFNFISCSLNQSSIDAILAAFVAAGRNPANATTFTPLFPTCLIALNGGANATPSFTGGRKLFRLGAYFFRSGTTVTANVSNHGFSTGNIVTITGNSSFPTLFQGTFIVNVINIDQFQYTTISSGTATGAGGATLRTTTNASDGYRSYQQLALVSQPGGPWNITINQP